MPGLKIFSNLVNYGGQESWLPNRATFPIGASIIKSALLGVLAHITVSYGQAPKICGTGLKVVLTELITAGSGVTNLFNLFIGAHGNQCVLL